MTEQLSFLSDLDRASDTRKPNLCKNWKNAIMNDCGVFVENRVDIVVYKTTKKIYPRVTIHCALEYPKVYYSFDAMGNTAGGGGYPGRDSHNFDVHEHAANVALMVEHELRDRVKSYEITDKMIDECIEKFKTAIMSESELVNGVCKRCGIEIMESLMEHGLCPACNSLIKPKKSKTHKVELIVTKEPPSIDDFGSVEELNEKRMENLKKKLVDGGWKICSICNEAFAGLCSNGLCVECDFKKKHPDAKKKFCEQCIHFHYHNLYDENDHTECCCKLHLEGKNRGEWSYLCNDFIKCETVEQHEEKREGLVKYASCKGLEKCPKCGKKYRFLYKGICGPCYEQNLKKAEEIERKFKAEGYKEINENERENAMYCLGGWIDERDMPAMEKMVGTRYFLIDVMTLTWRFFFRREAA